MFKKALIAALALIGTQAVSVQRIDPLLYRYTDDLSIDGVQSEQDYIRGKLPINGGRISSQD